jgi:hypothetical protein
MTDRIEAIAKELSRLMWRECLKELEDDGEEDVGHGHGPESSGRLRRLFPGLTEAELELAKQRAVASHDRRREQLDRRRLDSKLLSELLNDELHREGIVRLLARRRRAT